MDKEKSRGAKEMSETQKGIELDTLFINPSKTERFLLEQFDQLVQDNLELENNQKRLTITLEKIINILEQLQENEKEIRKREAIITFKVMKIEGKIDIELYCKKNRKTHTTNQADDIWEFTKGYNKALNDLLSTTKKKAGVKGK